MSRVQDCRLKQSKTTCIFGGLYAGWTESMIVGVQPVKCGYCGWLIQGCQNIIDHSCLAHYDEESHLLRVDDNFVATLIKRTDATQEPDPQEVLDGSPDADELLIQAVLVRPGLYNTTLPVKDRTKLKKEALWLEISNSLGGTSEDVKKRWQYLRDCFIKEKRKLEKYCPSGSAACSLKKPTFRYYEQMKFLRDSLPNIQTISNIDSPTLSNDSGCSGVLPNTTPGCSTAVCGSSSSSIYSQHSPALYAESAASPSPPPRTPTPGGKKRKTDDRNAELRSALVASLQQPVPAPDAVDGFLARLGEGLRRIPYRERAVLEIRFLTMLMEVEERLNS